MDHTLGLAQSSMTNLQLQKLADMEDHELEHCPDLDQLIIGQINQQQACRGYP